MIAAAKWLVVILAGTMVAGCATAKPSSQPQSPPPALAPSTLPAATPVGTTTPSPAATAEPSRVAARPLVDMDADDGFSMTLEADSNVREGDLITASVTLANVNFAEAPFVLSAGSPLLALSVTEVGGDRRAFFDSDGGCAPFGIWKQGEPMILDFRLLPAYGLTVEPAAWDFVGGPGFKLPVGTWRLDAEARLFGPECDDTENDVRLHTQVTIEVQP